MIKSISSKVISLSSLKRKIATYRRQGKTIVFTNGCFDLLHWGHASYLATAKKNDQRVLIVGLNSDASVKKQNKGRNRPIIHEKERALLLSSLQAVDHVVIFNQSTPLLLIQSLKPDVLIKGADWQGQEVAGARDVQSYGGRMEFVSYLKGLSTTRLIEKIKKSL